MRELKVVTIEEIKAQARVDFDGEEELLKLYGLAAEDVIIKGTYRSLDELKKIGYKEATGIELTEEALPEGEWFPPGLKLAILMLAAQSYRVREPVANVSQNPVPYAFDIYIKPYRRL